MRRLLLVAFLVVFAGCGGSGPEAGEPARPAPAPNVLPRLASSERTLDARRLAADSLHRDELAHLLGAAGYVSGTEREFAGRSKTFEHVVLRTLRFRTPAGANRYVAWVARHPDDFLGRTKRERPLDVGTSALLVSLARCGTCKKEVPAFLAAWRTGAVVVTLLGSGPGVDRSRFARLAVAVDARMRA